MWLDTESKPTHNCHTNIIIINIIVVGIVQAALSHVLVRPVLVHHMNCLVPTHV